jgi:hypothetical protein
LPIAFVRHCGVRELLSFRSKALKNPTFDDITFSKALIKKLKALLVFHRPIDNIWQSSSKKIMKRQEIEKSSKIQSF